MWWLSTKAPGGRAVLAAVVAVCALSVTPALPQQNPPPEDSTGWQRKTLTVAKRHLVAAAHPRAVKAGLEILRAGGNAVDAAIAVQLVLNLVEPQSSGIGGGAFLLHHDGATGTLTTYDGRETAPARATPGLFLDADGKPMAFRDAVVGGRPVGVPGVVALMAKAHAAHGRLPWNRLFEPAIALARTGFVVGPRLAAMLAGPRAARLRAEPTARAYFFPGGIALKAGDVVRNPAFADTLTRIAEGGRAAFYSGAIARDIAAAVQGHAGNPGSLGEADLDAYKAVERAPVCLVYRVYRVCGMGPPSSGGQTVGQILGLLERFDLPDMSPEDALPWHLLAEASKLAFADRNRFSADADYVPVPVRGLLDRGYLAARARLFDAAEAMPVPTAAGAPPWREGRAMAPDNAEGRPGTSHISIVDGDGNAVAMTTTIEGAFGAHLMVRGFLLNNQLTDFSFRPKIDGVPVANAVAPGKRPRSSMAPTIVYDRDGGLRLVVGSPGGSQIIGYVAKTLIAVLDWNMDVQAAIDLHLVVNRNGPTDIEEHERPQALAAALAARGHEIRFRQLNSGLHVIEIRNGMLYGGADPRREGIALGD
mgnify:CR=1 FL=1